jgi:hypothetical protein
MIGHRLIQLLKEYNKEDEIPETDDCPGAVAHKLSPPITGYPG